jgi:hypothetical protein
LAVNVKTDDQYLVNLLEVSPMKNEFVSVNYDNSVVVNRVACGDARDQKENLDRDFGEVWQATLWGGKTPAKEGKKAYNPYGTGRSSSKSAGSAARYKRKGSAMSKGPSARSRQSAYGDGNPGVTSAL